jgi:hypothetical protein
MPDIREEDRRRTMELAINRIRRRPNAKSLTLHVVRGEGAREGFYRKFGFWLTGQIEPESRQHEMNLDLQCARYENVGVRV